MTDLPREARESLRRLHVDEPIEMTNPRAKAASSILVQLSSPEGVMTGVSRDQALAGAQVQATLALAQEVKNLRLAMYPTSGVDQT